MSDIIIFESSHLKIGIHRKNGRVGDNFTLKSILLMSYIECMGQGGTGKTKAHKSIEDCNIKLGETLVE